MKLRSFSIVGVVAAFLLSTVAFGQTVFDIAGDTADLQLHSDGTARWAGQTSHRVGRTNNSGVVVSTNSIYVFALPALNAGDVITGAHLSFDLIGGSWWPPEGVLDAYGLGFRAAAAPQASDFYQGAYGGDATDATPIQHGFGVPAWAGGQSTTVAGAFGTDAGGDQALVNYLNAQVAAGAVGGNFVFIRLNYDTEQTTESYAELTCANSASPVMLTIIVNGGSMGQTPVADAGADRSVSDDDGDGAEQVTLDGTASTDPDGSIVSYAWSEVGSALATGATPTVSLPVGTHTITLTVTDNDGYADTDTVDVTVVDPNYNEAPIADAGSAQSVEDSDGDGVETVTLDGSGSTDADGTIVSYAWAEGNSSIAAGATATVTLTVGTHSITLTVTDDDGAVDTDTVTVSVVNPEADLLNLPAPTADRFPITEKVWPATPGAAHVCLWKDDAHAAVSITIDDNTAPDHPWWTQTTAAYDIPVTWFIITCLVDEEPVWRGTWDGFQTLVDAGNEVQSHTVTHLNFDRGFDPNDPAHDILVEYTASQAEIEQQLGVRCQTLAYPGGTNTIYNDDALAAEYYIAARGTVGTINPVNRVNYMRTNSVGNGLAVTSTSAWTQLVNLFDATAYHADNYRGWYVTHFHGLTDDLKTQIITGLDYLQTKNVEVGVWIAPFRQAAQYGQERDTVELSIVSADETGVRFTLTDRMIDAAFDFPLTVKVRLFDAWDEVAASQGGQSVGVEVVENGGARFALIQATPDRGEVLLAPAAAALPGDANSDDKVDINDFVILKNHFGSGSTWAEGDFNGDGAVDIDDFVILKNNFGSAAN